VLVRRLPADSVPDAAGVMRAGSALWVGFTAMKLLYKPFGLLAGIVGGLLARRVFDAVWARIDDEQPPKPTTELASWPRVVTAAAVQGATFSATRAVVDRAGARTFHHLLGIWPGERTPEPKD
jgi:hypothetical protein